MGKACDSTASSSTATNKRAVTSQEKYTRFVWAGRLLFILCLVVVAALLGILAHYILTESETELAEIQFESIADRALNEAVGVAKRTRLSLTTMSSMIATMHPNANDWPFVAVPNYENIGKNILSSSGGIGIPFLPIVTPDERSDWEDFAYDYYEKTRNPPFPNGTAVSSFGKGIWAEDKSLDTPDKRYHDKTGISNWGSPNEILVPTFHSDKGADHAILMLNVHFEPTRGQTIDNIIECSRKRAAVALSATTTDDGVELTNGNECGGITGMVMLMKKDLGVGAIIFSPIYPLNNETKITGFVAALLVWDAIFENIFADEVRGIDCILETETEAFTYTVMDGVAIIVGVGDFHDRRYDKFRRSVVLTDAETYCKGSQRYTLSLYPNDDFYSVYHTFNPVVASAGAVCIIILTSILFLMYDFFVRRESSARKDLLEARRRFMRFISHEVRTPLNSVFMGLSIIQDDLASSLGYESAAALTDSEIAPLSNKTMNGTNSTTQEYSNNTTLECFHLATEIQSNAQSAIDVLNDLLNYDKTDSGQFRLELTFLSIWHLIQKTAKEFVLPASNKEINLELRFKGNEEPDEESSPLSSASDLQDNVRNLQLVGDAVRLTQVFRNLISNALKFTPKQGTVRIRASWIPPPDEKKEATKKKPGTNKFKLKDGREVIVNRRGYVQVCVEDTGAGLSEDQMARLFHENVQFNANELQAGGGSGLGLYITKGIVLQHEGILKATSEGLGQGTTFTVTLPLFDALEEIEKNSDNENNSDTSHTQGTVSLKSDVESNALRILIVEDVASNRKLLTRMLKKSGHICEEAENGAIGVDMVMTAEREGNPFDTLLMDFEMPVMNGPDAAKKIRLLGSDVFIVGVTGNALEEDVAFFKSCGANAVLPKPFKLNELDDLLIEYGLIGQGTSSKEEWEENKKNISIGTYT